MSTFWLSLVQEIAVAILGLAVWQLRTIRRAQVEQGLKIELLTGLMDGRTTKLAQDFAALRRCWEDEDAASQ